jgi:membrane-bound ClpP family serine protease
LSSKSKTKPLRAGTVLKYALVQVVDLALLIVVLLFLDEWLDIPTWFTVALIAFWIIKDVLLFPLLRRAYEGSSTKDDDIMTGATGVARERLAPSGYVWIKGELWLAEVAVSGQVIEPGKAVKVLSRRGLTLLVVPDHD